MNMEFFGFLFAILIGISLGLIGGGGSILTVPVLVYLFKIEPVTATAYSLFIVGATSLVGVLPKYQQRLVQFKTALVFGAPAIAAVFVTRKYLIPAIPDVLFSNGFLVFTKSILTMIVFALLMITASVSMIRDKRDEKEENVGIQKFNYPLILLEGCVVGILTGFVGAGGGFLIIPALVLLSKLPIKMAIGTSLVIIAAKSLIGFLGDLSLQSHHSTINNPPFNWTFLLTFTTLSVAGIFIGSFLSKKIEGNRLKVAFGWFVLAMGIYIILKELLLR
jgi:uncharacterized protein